MDKLLLPSKIKFKKGSSVNEAVLEMEPAYHGYGITIGNALRRVLLSSLPGAAITSVKITGATHEFTTIPNVKEDILEIILNLKQVRLRIHSDEPVRLILDVTGEKKVTAGDIQANADVEIVNPNSHIATLTDKKSEFKLELIAEKGRGYRVTEEKESAKLESGMIAIDAIFTPIRNVAIDVENVRVGQITNFDKLSLTVETDGTLTPQEAVSKAAQLLIDNFSLLTGDISDSEEEVEVTEEEVTPEETEEEASESEEVVDEESAK